MHSLSFSPNVRKHKVLEASSYCRLREARERVYIIEHHAQVAEESKDTGTTLNWQSSTSGKVEIPIDTARLDLLDAGGATGRGRSTGRCAHNITN